MHGNPWLWETIKQSHDLLDFIVPQNLEILIWKWNILLPIPYFHGWSYQIWDGYENIDGISSITPTIVAILAILNI